MNQISTKYISNALLPSENYKVMVQCFTYNHAKYIVEALGGFSNQKTQFPYLCLIMDDCSTDGEQDIIRDWLMNECNMSEAREVEDEVTRLIVAQSKFNKNCTFVVYLFKVNLYCKAHEKLQYIKPWEDKVEYIAFCEGDDYWISNDKLQSQVSYLDQHADCSLVRTDFRCYIQKDNELKPSFCHEGNGRYIKDDFEAYVLNAWFNGPLTLMYRKSVLRYRSYFYNRTDTFRGTIIYTLTACLHSTIYFMDSITAHYRVLEKSASHFSNFNDAFSFVQKTIITRIIFANNCNLKIRYKLLTNIIYRIIRMTMKTKRWCYIKSAIILSFGYINKLFLWQRKNYMLTDYDTNKG